MKKSSKSKKHKVLDYLYLSYFGLIPSLATFLTLGKYGFPWKTPFLNFVSWIFLITPVALFLVFQERYLALSKKDLLIWLFSTPLFVIGSSLLLKQDISLIYSINNTFLIEAAIIGFSICYLALFSDLPEHFKNQKLISFFLILIVLGMTFYTFWNYISLNVINNWQNFLAFLTPIIAKSTYAQTLEKDLKVRNEDSGGAYVAIFILLWSLSFFAAIAYSQS